jgi:hypothetical protein
MHTIKIVYDKMYTIIEKFSFVIVAIKSNTSVKKVIKNKIGLLELSNHLGSASRACKISGYS